MLIEWGLINRLILFDHRVQLWMGAMHYPLMIWIFKWITRLGNSPTIVSLTILVTLYAIIKRRWSEAIVMNTGLTCSYLIMAYLKLLFSRVRPLGEHLVAVGGYSLPSGHAMLSLAAYGFIAYLMHKHLPHMPVWKFIVPAAVLIFLIGVSRVYLNVHYASDVAAGFIIGGILLSGMICLDKWFIKHYSSK